MAKMPVVLDKSFLVGSTPTDMADLCAEYLVLMTEALFFELLLGPARECQEGFRKFPTTTNPVELVAHVGTLLAYEAAEHSPATPLTDRLRPVNFRFNEKLATGSFVLTSQQVAGANDWRAFVAELAAGFKERSAALPNWFPALAGYKPGMPSTVIEDVGEAVASDGALIRSIYDSFRPSSFPAGSEIEGGWAGFRWTQVQLLYGLEYIRRYGPNSKMEAKAIQHDVIDMQYVITGVLGGAMASHDGFPRAVFRRLLPEGLLIPSETTGGTERRSG
ncbi:MAG TPA: hypothetical protein VHQ90_19515 [Thermoanaerobaculia bacterium]|nr:hypothetical protein [Thermoanaerobaculia bacterium]